MSNVVTWQESTPRSARWQSESGAPPPQRVAVVGDRLTADEALRRLSRGEHLLYRGDYRNAKQLLDAVGRRLRKKAPRPARSLADAFRAERDARWREATTLGRLLVSLGPDYGLELSHGPEVRAAFTELWGKPEATLLSLRELQGVLGAAEWRRKGIEVPALGARIHPHYGVFSPTRSEYVDLVVRAPAPKGLSVLEVGTGTGVLACLLAKRGAARVVATDIDPRAVECARENADRLGFSSIISVEQADLFPAANDRFDRILFNPPWIPERPRAPIDRAIYDDGAQNLLRFLKGAESFVAPAGEVWLIISDLAERLELRPTGWLAEQLEAAGWKVAEKLSTPPRHGRAQDKDDPLHAARGAEQTSLYRLLRH